jgi:hypothetical protein
VVIVILHHAISALDPLSFNKIGLVVEMATLTCGDIYRHASLQNATAKRLETQVSWGMEDGTGSSGQEGVHEHNDIILRSIDAELYPSITMPAGC